MHTQVLAFGVALLVALTQGRAHLNAAVYAGDGASSCSSSAKVLDIRVDMGGCTEVFNDGTNVFSVQVNEGDETDIVGSLYTSADCSGDVASTHSGSCGECYDTEDASAYANTDLYLRVDCSQSGIIGWANDHIPGGMYAASGGVSLVAAAFAVITLRMWKQHNAPLATKDANVHAGPGDYQA